MSRTCSNCQTQLRDNAKFCSECGRQVTAPEEKPAPRTKLLVAVILGFVILFVILVVAGYAFNWSWTGYSKYQLWDWLTLLVFPGAIASLSIWFVVDKNLADEDKIEERHRWRKRWIELIIIALIALIVSIIGGYGFNWGWTGFRGNTLADWVKLLFVPVVLPLVAAWFVSHPIKLNNSGP